MAFKFIIVCSRESWDMHHPKAEIRLGNVIYHKSLRGTGNYVFGGGDFRINDKTKTIWLSGNSGDYGYPELDGELWEWEKFWIDSDWKDYKFIYKDPFYNMGKEIDLTPLIEFKDE
jgi:hypothetical protein